MTGTNELFFNPINVISASAGTGKTYRLSREYLDGLRRITDTENPSGIMATTFTNKAADELVERVRSMLLDDGDWIEAQCVLTGYLGTVNSICGRLLSEHAIDAGLSPDLTVIAEERLPSIFAIAVDAVVHQFAREMHDASTRLQIENWRHDVLRVIDLARNNKVKPERLLDLADESWTGLSRLMSDPQDGETEKTLDRNLAEAIETALAALPAPDDDTAATRSVIEFLEDVNRKLKSGANLVWQAWARLSKLKPGKGSRQAVQPIIEAASAHSRHPRLHEDLKIVVYGVFECASAAMERYAEFKREHGLIDFVDQELLALKILQQPEVREAFRRKVQVLLVDEFQDTSPIQLAIFLEISQLVGYSVWVGDEKQSIFSFRGSDPDLMRSAISDLVSRTGGDRHRLATSYRSRPPLVGFTNALFSMCAQLEHVTVDSPVIEHVNREEATEQSDPLHLWWLPGKRKEESLEHLAQGIKDVLDNCSDWQVLDRETNQLRDIRGSDIAILCRTNASRVNAANALVSLGLTVATERDELLSTPECLLALAALRILIDDTDTLAEAELANYLSADVNKESSVWLDALLSKDHSQLDELIPTIKSLKQDRASLYNLTPLEALELAITSDGIVETIMSWGNVRQRLANLDSLRGLARSYQDVCASARLPATAAGLLVHLQKRVADGGHQPANPDETGIHIITYHKSKGLEWPMVILFDLDTHFHGSPFGISTEAPEEGIDSLNPLANRSIRYWPWPYGRQKRDLPLTASASRTREARLATKRGKAESLRLLYVGMTRARDYLVLACRNVSYSTEWLKSLTDKQFDLPILSLTNRDGDEFVYLIDDVPNSKARVCTVELKSDSATSTAGRQSVFGPLELESDSPVHTPYYLSPSAATMSDAGLELVKTSTISIGERIELTGRPDMQRLGDCVHCFLAIDLCKGMEDTARRVHTAQTVLSNWSIDNITAEDLLAASNRLQAHIKDTYKIRSLSTEVPVSGKLGLRRMRGNIDLLLETKAGYVVIDHKTFPGRFDQWEEKASSFAPQLALYSRMIEVATGKSVIGQFIHMPVVGALVEVKAMSAT